MSDSDPPAKKARIVVEKEVSKILVDDVVYDLEEAARNITSYTRINKELGKKLDAIINGQQQRYDNLYRFVDILNKRINAMGDRLDKLDPPAKLDE